MIRKLPDPRVIFALVLFFSSYGLLIRDVRLMAALLCFSLLCAVALEVNGKRLFWQLKRLWQLVLAIAFIQSIFAPSGAVLLALWDIPLLTEGGILKGLLVLFRISLILTSAMMLTAYPTRVLIQGMVQIRLPYEVAYMVSVGIRFVPQMREELQDSLTALQLRGIVIEELPFKKRFSLYSYLLLPVIATSLQNAQGLAMSMEMRAFRAMKERTSYQSLKLGHHDILLLCTISFVAIAIAVFKLGGTFEWM